MDSTGKDLLKNEREKLVNSDTDSYGTVDHSGKYTSFYW